MKRVGFRSVSALALVVAFAGGPLLAQGYDDATAAGLARLGVQAPPIETLTTGQQAEIQNVLSSTDTDEAKRAQIDLILGAEATQTGNLGVTQLQDSVAADLSKIGVDASAVGVLTVDQLAQIENVLSGGDSDATKKMRVEEIVGGEAVETQRLGVAQLQDSVGSGLAQLGIDAGGVETLSMEQLAQIENIFNSSATDESKKAQIETIMAR